MDAIRPEASAAERATDRPAESRPARWLWALAVLSVTGAGLLLWGRYGGSVFADMVSAAIAWCF